MTKRIFVSNVATGHVCIGKGCLVCAGIDAVEIDPAAGGDHSDIVMEPRTLAALIEAEIARREPVPMRAHQGVLGHQVFGTGTTGYRSEVLRHMAVQSLKTAGLIPDGPLVPPRYVK
jgi:hypothetical protein